MRLYYWHGRPQVAPVARPSPGCAIHTTRACKSGGTGSSAALCALRDGDAVLHRLSHPEAERDTQGDIHESQQGAAEGRTEAKSDLSDRRGSLLLHHVADLDGVLTVAIALRDPAREGSQGRPMNSRHVVAWVNLGMLYLAGIVGLVAQKWTVGGLVLAASVILTFPLIALDRRDRRPGSESLH